MLWRDSLSGVKSITVKFEAQRSIKLECVSAGPWNSLAPLRPAQDSARRPSEDHAVVPVRREMMCQCQVEQ